jgi:RNA polymerase sigma-70 factor (ECF subfamily)
LGRDADVERLRSGDHGALGPLLGRFGQRLYRYLLRLVRDQAAADDLFQQTWVRAVERIERYDPRRDFAPWLFAVARNLAIDELRRLRPESIEEAEDADLPASRAEDVERGYIERIERDERARRVRDVLGQLSLGDREALTLRFEEDMTLPQMAELLGVPLPTAKARLYRAMARLEGRLRALGSPGGWA